MIPAMIMAIETEEERTFVAELFDRYHANILAICNKVLRNPHNAEEAASETFEKIIQNASKLQAVSKDELPALLHTYAEHTAINYYNKLKRQNEHTTSSTYHEENISDDFQMSLPDHIFDTEQYVLDHEFIAEVSRMLEELPAPQRQVALLKWFGNYRNNEIAQMLEIDTNLVNAYVFLVRKKLKKMLRP